MSFNLQESVLLLQDQDETIPIQNELDVPAMSEGEAMDYLERESLYLAGFLTGFNREREGEETREEEGRKSSTSCCCFPSELLEDPSRPFQAL